MNLTAKKEEIVKRIYEEQDVSVIYAVKELLDIDSNTLKGYDTYLENALDHAFQQSENGEGRPHDEVWAAIKTRYKL